MNRTHAAFNQWRPWQNDFDLDRIYVKDCGGGGECQFLVVADAVAPLHQLTPAQLRCLAGAEVLKLSDDLVHGLLATYRKEVDKKRFSGNWNPYNCRTRNDLKRAIEAPNESGNSYDFQGDAVTLDLLSKSLKLNVFVYHQNEGHIYNNHNANQYTIFLLYHCSKSFKHYQLLGVKNARTGRTESLFERERLPEVLQRLLQRVTERNKLRRRRRQKQSQPAVTHDRKKEDKERNHDNSAQEDDSNDDETTVWEVAGYFDDASVDRIGWQDSGSGDSKGTNATAGPVIKARGKSKDKDGKDKNQSNNEDANEDNMKHVHTHTHADTNNNDAAAAGPNSVAIARRHHSHCDFHSARSRSSSTTQHNDEKHRAAKKQESEETSDSDPTTSDSDSYGDSDSSTSSFKQDEHHEPHHENPRKKHQHHRRGHDHNHDAHKHHGHRHVHVHTNDEKQTRSKPVKSSNNNKATDNKRVHRHSRPHHQPDDPTHKHGDHKRTTNKKRRYVIRNNPKQWFPLGRI